MILFNYFIKFTKHNLAAYCGHSVIYGKTGLESRLPGTCSSAISRALEEGPLLEFQFCLFKNYASNRLLEDFQVFYRQFSNF